MLMFDGFSEPLVLLKEVLLFLGSFLWFFRTFRTFYWSSGRF